MSFGQYGLTLCDKVVSSFELHTDIIVQDRRELLYVRKICLTSMHPVS